MFFVAFFCVFCLLLLALACGVVWWTRDWSEYGWACAGILYALMLVLT